MGTATQPDLSEIRAELRQIIGDIIGTDPGEIDEEASLLDYVTSSLSLLTGIRRVYDRFGVLVPIRPLFEGSANLRALSALIDQSLKVHENDAPATTQPDPEEIEDGPRIPLAPSQQHIGFLARYSSGASSAYNACVAVRLRGLLHGPALQAAAEAVVERYQATRAVLSRDDDAISFCADRFKLPVTRCADDDLSDHLGRFAWEIFAPGGRLFRALLLRVSDTDHVLALAGHELVVDREALIAVLEDIATFYAGFSRGDEAQPAPPAVQLTDYLARYQEEAVKQARFAAKTYWSETFTGGCPRLELPCDRPRPPIKSYAGARVAVPVPDDVHAGLLTSSDLSASAIMFGAFTAFLHRLAMQTEIVVGTRSRPILLADTSRAVCTTRDMLPLRSGYDPRQSFADHVRAAAARLAEANDYRHLSLAEIIRLLEAPRDQSRQPLFSTSFRAEVHDAPPAFEALGSKFVTVPTVRARYDIELVLASSPGALQLWCDYAPELFEADTISRWLEGLLEFVRAGLADKERPLGLLPMMPHHARRILLQEWNATEKPYPRDRTTLDLIADRAREQADFVAIRCNGKEATYAQLLTRAEGLAAMLAGSEVRPGDRVAILLRRSPDLVASILGTWRAGAAYVPLDPDLPKQRIAFMLADAEVGTILTSDDLTDWIDAASGIRCLCIGDARPGAIGLLPAMPTSMDSAYVMYTSGSTGQPKGVEIVHGALLNCLIGMQGRVGFSGSDTLLAITTPSFDISTGELFMPLIAGGIVELAEDGVAADGIRLARHIDSCRPSFVQATPSSWKAVLAAGWTGNRDVCIGATGEALGRNVAEQLLARGRALWNLYGPTETTVWATMHPVRSAPSEPMRIGRPLPNTHIYILDDQLQPVPVGVIGELYIGGDGLARGYLRRPQLTAERFVANPFRRGDRLYRTGDLARYLPNGDIICLGRIDEQVKIHGHRVELGEIELALRAVVGVRDAVVSTWIDGDSDKQLAAYVVADATGALTAARIREWLRKSLPEAMIPPLIMFCDSVPVTASGKIDRAALPTADPGKAVAALRTAPVTATERLVAKAWAKVLRLAADRINRDDDFMDLGGHSLLMTQLMVEVRRVFHVTFSMQDFFVASTVRKFAALINELQRASTHEASSERRTRARDSDWGRERMSFLRREAELPSNIAPARGLWFEPQPVIRTVLLTGATGFLGAHIVAEILRTTDAHLYCLVRPKQGAISKDSIAQQLRHYALWKDDDRWHASWEQRVDVLSGDVILPCLGFTDRTYELLARDIDCIIHSAAHVNFIYPYEALKATNVLGLHEIIRFAFHGRIKPVHFLSTAAVWPMGAEHTFFETDPLDHGKLLNLGYDETKWVGEKCLLNAAERGLPVGRYRPGEVGGDSKTGRCVLNHFAIAAFKGFLQYGAFPLIDTHVDVAPVDYVTKAIVHMVFHKGPLGRAFHLTNPRACHMREALAFLRNAGYEFEEVGFEELRSRLAMSAEFADNALFPYQAALDSMDERSLQLPKYDCSQTLQELKGSAIVCPAADETLFATYLRYLTDILFLPHPSELPI